MTVYSHVYLPDELGRRAKDAGLNLSRLLREAVEQELHEDEAEIRIEPGVYRAGRIVVVHLNAAHRAKRNGVELAPAEPIPEPPRRSLRIPVDALKRWLKAFD